MQQVTEVVTSGRDWRGHAGNYEVGVAAVLDFEGLGQLMQVKTHVRFADEREITGRDDYCGTSLLSSGSCFNISMVSEVMSIWSET